MQNKKVAVEIKGLTREAILGAQDVAIERVSTPEWGKDSFVWIKSMTGSERDWFEGRFSELEGAGKFLDFRAKLCSLVICDEGGTNLFAESDIKQLGTRNAKTLDRIFDAGMALSGLDKDALDTSDDFFDETQPKGSGSN